MRHSSRNSGNSLQIAVVFICSIFLLLFAGLLLKLFLLFSASTFDGSHQYIVMITGNQKEGAFISYNPSAKTASLVTVTGKINGDYASALGVPVDASVSIPISGDLSKMTQHMLFVGKDEKNMTIIDALRLFLFVNTLNANNVHTVAISMPLDDKTRATVLSSVFLDSVLYTDNKSVAIVNATGESGLGSDVAHMLTTIGISVVSVTTADNDQQQSTLVATSDDTYTVRRMSKIFHIPVMRKQQTISDITLTLGKESISQLQ